MVSQVNNSAVIATLTRDNLDTGLRGIPVGTTVTSSVDPAKGVHYRGIAIDQLTGCTPEEVVYLIFEGKFSADMVTDLFRDYLLTKRELPESVRKVVAGLPVELSPMEMLSIAVMCCSVCQSGDWKEDGLSLVAKMPELVKAVIDRCLESESIETADAKVSIGLVENFVEGLQLQKDKPLFMKAMKLYYILHCDHGGGNLSTFIGKGVASSGQHLYGAFSSAVTALGGPAHGGAVQDSVNFIQEMLKSLGNDPTVDQVSAYVETKVKAKEKIPGFGHAVLQCEDPRATLLYEFAEDHLKEHPMVKVALMLRRIVPALLGQLTRVRNPNPNVDAISGTVLWAAGFPYPQFYPLLFALSRSVGIARQIIYERTEAREGKGVPIYRPKYLKV
jgi:citrate synthase